MQEECLICKAPLEYLRQDEEMECSLCHKKERSKTRCINGHYVCNECHTKGIDTILTLCLRETSKNPVQILENLMDQPFCHMHGPEHHVMVGTALLTAYKNAGGEVDLKSALLEMESRGRSVPGGACGFWGACGAGISAGMFVSIISKSTPLTVEPFGLSNRMTARALDAIGRIGGPRCCKRDSFLSVLAAVDFVQEHFHIVMEKEEVFCHYLKNNNQCIGKRCPFITGEKKRIEREQAMKKKIAFVCVHNSCRSQIAEALGKYLGGDRFEFYSAGTRTVPQINQDAVRLMKKLYGIDMEKTQYSKTIDQIPAPDIAVSMGCDVECPLIGRAFDDNWNLPDPTGQSDAVFLDVIRKIETNIRKLATALEKSSS